MLNGFDFFIFFAWTVTGCKESQFYSLPFGQAVALHVAHKSFQLAPKPLLISRIDYSPSVIWISQKKNSSCLSGKLRTKFTSPIAKSPSPGLSDMTFFSRCSENQQYTWITFVWILVIVNFQESNDDSPAVCLAQLDDNDTDEVIQIVCCLVTLCLTYNIIDNNVHKRLLNSDWLRKECSSPSPVTRVQVTNGFWLTEKEKKPTRNQSHSSCFGFQQTRIWFCMQNYGTF